MSHRYELELGGRPLIIETGTLAQQAGGAVTVRYGDTMMLGTVTAGKPRPGIDFFPLTIEFEERLYAAGRIPGSFFRREGRPTTSAVLSARLTDRPLRPLFPAGYGDDTQTRDHHPLRRHGEPAGHPRDHRRQRRPHHFRCPLRRTGGLRAGRPRGWRTGAATHLRAARGERPQPRGRRHRGRDHDGGGGGGRGPRAAPGRGDGAGPRGDRRDRRAPAADADRAGARKALLHPQGHRRGGVDGGARGGERGVGGSPCARLRLEQGPSATASATSSGRGCWKGRKGRRRRRGPTPSASWSGRSCVATSWSRVGGRTAAAQRTSARSGPRSPRSRARTAPASSNGARPRCSP